MFEHISFSNTYILLERHSNRIIAHYAVGEVSTVELYSDLNEWNCTVYVIYRTGERYSWNSNNLYFPAFYLYGISVSIERNYLFAQQDQNGLACLDLRTGRIIWKNQRKSEYTHILVCKKTICCAKGKNEIQSINIADGKVLFSHRVTYSNRFETLNEKAIINQSFRNRCEVLNPETLEVIETIYLNDTGRNHQMHRSENSGILK